MSAQRYTLPLALDRMSKGLCPECGCVPEQHDSDPRFWVHHGCSLVPIGVVDRIAQYRADVAATS